MQSVSKQRNDFDECKVFRLFYGMCSHLFQSHGAEEFMRSSKTRSEPQLIMAVSTIVSGDAAKCVHLILCTQSNLFTHTHYNSS